MDIYFALFDFLVVTLQITGQKLSSISHIVYRTFVEEVSLHYVPTPIYASYKRDRYLSQKLMTESTVINFTSFSVFRHQWILDPLISENPLNL